ncbi:MAG: AglZ/HisF2 family acetamidino modification protein [Candidatus Omnitrophica bacterium]|nr:AglZ/HisF2 family acetamidino modification protein [Candidatus Omnitrophota bacterium]
MLNIRVIPCLLLQDGRLVKTVKFKNPSYVGNPINAIKIYNEKEVDELIVLDITATSKNRNPSFELLSEIAEECFMPLTYGGGVRSMEDLQKLFTLGIEKVAINTYAIENPSLIKEAAISFGSQSIVVAVDVKKNIWGKYMVCSHGGQKPVNLSAIEHVQKMAEMGAGEIFLNSIDRDGTWNGYDLDLIRMISASVQIPVIACGGAGSVDDFGRAVKEGGASAVAAGSMVVYQGKDLGVLINFPNREKLEKVLT